MGLNLKVPNANICISCTVMRQTGYSPIYIPACTNAKRPSPSPPNPPGTNMHTHTVTETRDLRMAALATWVVNRNERDLPVDITHEITTPPTPTWPFLFKPVFFSVVVYDKMNE